MDPVSSSSKRCRAHLHNLLTADSALERLMNNASWLPGILAEYSGTSELQHLILLNSAFAKRAGALWRSHVAASECFRPCFLAATQLYNIDLSQLKFRAKTLRLWALPAELLASALSLLLHNSSVQSLELGSQQLLTKAEQLALSGSCFLRHLSCASWLWPAAQSHGCPLAQSIRKLTMSRIDVSVFSTLAQLPLLKDLHVTLTEASSQATLADVKFANLAVLSVQCSASSSQCLSPDGENFPRVSTLALVCDGGFDNAILG